MDLTNLRKIVAIHTPIGGNVSFPFAVEKDGELKIRWFIYDLEKTGNDLQLRVKQAYTMDKNGRVAIKLNVKLNFVIETHTDTRDINEAKYYERFAQLFNENDKEGLSALLEFVEDEDSLAIYDAVAKLEDK